MMHVPCAERFRRKLLASVVAITLMSTSATALTVFDPTNYSQNLLTAARSLEQINHQITSLANEAQMLINQAKNLTSLPTSLVGQIDENFSEMRNLLGEAQSLAYSVESIDQEFAATYTDFAADKTGAELVTVARERWQTSVASLEHALKAGAVAVSNIDDTRAQTTALVDASQAAVGMLQVTQAGNQLVAVHTRQMADLTAMLAAQGRAEALEKARQAAAQEQARAQFRRFLNGTGYGGSTVRMFHD